MAIFMRLFRTWRRPRFSARALAGNMSSSSTQGTGKAPSFLTVTFTATVSPGWASTRSQWRVAVRLPTHDRASSRLTSSRASSTYME